MVELIRLFVVVLATAAGHSLASGHPAAGSQIDGPVVGATLGAMVGYVAGGVLGRFLHQSMGRVERRVEAVPAPQLLAGALGALVAGMLAALLGLAPALLMPPGFGLGVGRWALYGIVVWIGMLQGWKVAAAKSSVLLALAGLSTRPLVTARSWSGEGDGDAPAALVDSSAAIDGRLLAVAAAGFWQGALLVPGFVLEELQGMADAGDPKRRRRGRQGLDTLTALGTFAGVAVHTLDDTIPEHPEVDAKLVALARRLRVPLVTLDTNLARVAGLQGVRCLDVGRLAEGLRPAHAAGDVLSIRLTRRGKEDGQGVGFLDDGTMVVVGEASARVGEEVEVRVASSVQTSMGQMLFAALAT